MKGSDSDSGLSATVRNLTCAITGSRARKADKPGVPSAPAKQIELSHEAFKGS